MHFLKWLYEEKISMCQNIQLSLGVHMGSSKSLGTPNKMQGEASSSEPFAVQGDIVVSFFKRLLVVPSGHRNQSKI